MSLLENDRGAFSDRSNPPEFNRSRRTSPSSSTWSRAAANSVRIFICRFNRRRSGGAGRYASPLHSISFPISSTGFSNACPMPPSAPILIVGFPGETTAHFERYFNFVDRLPLAYFHVFLYSRRTGTTAAKMSARLRRDRRRMRSWRNESMRNFSRVSSAELQVLFEDREMITAS